MFHVIVSREVSIALGQLGLDREVLLRVLNRLFDQLEHKSHEYRKNRDSEDPDLFEYDHTFHGGGRWRSFRFSVNDVRAPGYLFVEGVSVD